MTYYSGYKTTTDFWNEQGWVGRGEGFAVIYDGEGNESGTCWNGLSSKYLADGAIDECIEMVQKGENTISKIVIFWLDWDEKRRQKTYKPATVARKFGVVFGEAVTS